MNSFPLYVIFTNEIFCEEKYDELIFERQFVRGKYV